MSVLALLGYALGFFVLLVLTQDINIFPGAFVSKLSSFASRRDLPQGVESEFVTAADGKRIEVWRYAAEAKTPLNPYRAIIFHGNGGTLENFFFTQLWFADQGITSYGFDYRGFGRSSGWPNEKGIYKDSDAVWEYVTQREKIDGSRVIILGLSVGGAPAARIASLHGPKLLILSAAFTDLKAVVKTKGLFALLAPFLWTKLPTIEYLKRLTHTKLIVMHGEADTIVPYSHSRQLISAYARPAEVVDLHSQSAGHNVTFYSLKDELQKALTAQLTPEV